MQVFFGLVCTFLTTLIPVRVRGGGQLSIRLVSYVNPGGKGENLRVCDGRFGFAFSACDHRFVVCADKHSGGNSVDRCHFGRVETPPIPDADTIAFQDNIQGLKNPILFNVTSWPASGGFMLKIDVWDDDQHSRDEHVELLYRKIVIKPSAGKNNQRAKSVMLHRRTRLTLEVAVFCDQDYFGESCDIYCRAENDSANGHHTCNNEGRKQCLKGWRGAGCRQIDHCADSPCRNNATCLQTSHSYSCQCPLGFQGSRCDLELCKDNYCKNGGHCYIVDYTNVCTCISGWTGVRCETRHESCDDVMCFNNGTCFEIKNQVQCVCTEGWQGNDCLFDLNECLHSPCHGHSKCINTDGSYSCECLSGWGGDDCMENQNHSRQVSLPDCPGGEVLRPSRCPEDRSLEAFCYPRTHKHAHFICQINGTCVMVGNGTCCICNADRDEEGDPDMTRDEPTPPCLGACSTDVQCRVYSEGMWVCNCTEAPCDLPNPGICNSLENNVTVLWLEPHLPPSYDKKVINEDRSAYLCSRIHLAIVRGVDTSDAMSPAFNHRQEGLLVMAAFENETDCVNWHQWISTNCSQPTSDEHQLDDGVTNYTSYGQSKKSRSNFVNWYPMIGLLAIPAIVIVVCLIVLRKRLLTQKTTGGGTLTDTSATFHNTLYEEINNR